MQLFLNLSFVKISIPKLKNLQQRDGDEGFEPYLKARSATSLTATLTAAHLREQWRKKAYLVYQKVLDIHILKSILQLLEKPSQ